MYSYKQAASISDSETEEIKSRKSRLSLPRRSDFFIGVSVDAPPSRQSDSAASLNNLSAGHGGCGPVPSAGVRGGGLPPSDQRKRAFFFSKSDELHFPTKLSAGKGLAIHENDFAAQCQTALKSGDLLCNSVMLFGGWRRYTSETDGGGFEPPVPFGTHAFQACTINRSVTHP